MALVSSRAAIDSSSCLVIIVFLLASVLNTKRLWAVWKAMALPFGRERLAMFEGFLPPDSWPVVRCQLSAAFYFTQSLALQSM
mmetsp:Transcript_3971/g.11065  ORF Transcript_3971/g.11065 Transcript_3971/m.11065 type:complete len:83 (+) Transcript_3971:246-494(+)